MNPYIGQKAYDFTAKAAMQDGSIQELFNCRNYLQNKKGILFFYPLDFTFVCPSEIIAFNNRIQEFSSRNAKLIGVSVDSHFSHHAWKSLSFNQGGIGKIDFPLVSDLNKDIAKSYDVLHPDSIAYRATFVIDEDFNIRHYSLNDLPLGRNVDEILRIIDAIDYHNKYGEVCPAGWKKGEKGMKPTQKGVLDYLVSNAEKL